MAIDASGNVYIADEGSHRIREIIVSSGLIFTIAGTGTGGYNFDGIAATAAGTRLIQQEFQLMLQVIFI